MKSSIAFLENNTVRKGAFIALACAAFVLAGQRAHAADDPLQVTITAPATKIVGHYADLTPIEQVTITAHVPFRPVYLTTNSGVALLKDRVVAAARHICWQTDQDADDSDDECVQRAVKDAQPQIEAAVARANAAAVTKR